DLVKILDEKEFYIVSAASIYASARACLTS
ncbi:MAG: hypothetical protein ACI8Q2_000769, partial [Candidatus Omnitrophota bacterium]